MIKFFKKNKDSEETCPSCKQGNLIETENKKGNIIKKYSCGHRSIGVSMVENVGISDSVKTEKKIVVEINENVDVSDSVTVVAGIYFELTDSVSVSGIKQNSSRFELVFDENNSNMLKGFRINGIDLDKQDQLIKAFQQAYRFTSLISLRTGMYIFHKRPQKIQNGKLTGGISFTMDAILTKLVNLNMNDNDLFELLDDDSKENQQLAHYTAGQRALEDANFSSAIREFYQVVENENISSLTKYKYLRDGLSHDELHYTTTIQELQNQFNIACIENPHSTLNPKGKYVDITSPIVQNILEKEAKILRIEVIRLLDSKIKVQTN